MLERGGFYRLKHIWQSSSRKSLISPGSSGGGLWHAGNSWERAGDPAKDGGDGEVEGC